MGDSPLDDILEEVDLNEGLSKEDQLTHYMASLGWRPKTPRAKDTLEYFRTYSDPNGRNGRAVVVVQKDSVGLEPKSLAYFTATIQVYVPALDTEARLKAPPFCREDILRIMAYFDTKDDRHEAEVIECALCGANVAEFSEVAGEKICLDCAKRKGLQ